MAKSQIKKQAVTEGPERDPLPPPFPVGTRLRCIKGFDAYVGAVDNPRESSKHPEDWRRVSGVGIEVTIDHVVLGRRGTGRQLRDEDGPMYYEDTGEPIIDETQDGYSVYYVVTGATRAAKMSGRCIRPEDAEERWEVIGQPSKWVGFCSKCGVEDGQPCVGMSDGDSVMYPRTLKRPHRERGAKQLP